MRYKSEILEMIHENATANFEIGAISEARMREYDEMCFVAEVQDSADSKVVQKTENLEEVGHINFVPV